MQANYNWRTAENARLLTAPWNELSADDQEVAIKLAEEFGERLMVNKSELWDSKSYHEKLQKVFAEAQMVPDDLPLPENDERVKFFLRGAENGKLQINRSDDVPYAVVDYYNNRVLWHGMAHDPERRAIRRAATGPRFGEHLGQVLRRQAGRRPRELGVTTSRRALQTPCPAWPCP